MTGSEQVDGKNTSVLQVGTAEQKVVWNVDPESGRVLRASYDGMTQTGPAKMVETFSEWKTNDGITLPSHVSRAADGKEMMSIDVSSFKINAPVDPKIFDKPAAAPSQ